MPSLCRRRACYINLISFSGRLGYEVCCKPQHLVPLVDAIEKRLVLIWVMFGGCTCLLSTRLEKGLGVCMVEYRSDYNAFEPGLDALI